MQGYLPRYVRVFLLDDHDIVRKGLRDLLAPATDIHVVGDSGSARHAGRAILALEADVMVLDLQMQDGTGISVCREVRSVDPSISGLLLTASSDQEAIVSAILAGAAGYLVKLARSSDIVAAIRRVAAGKSLIDPATTAQVTRQLVAGMDELRPPVTEYEREIVTHVVRGLTNRQIAERMGLSLEPVAADVTTLIERMTRPLSRQGSEPGSVPPGKHRRPDG